MLKSFSIFTMLLTVLTLSACNSDSNKDKNKDVSPNAVSGDYLASYEADDGCSTGRQIFKGTTEEEIGTAFCNALKDEKLNKNCAHFLRANLFASVQCPGEFPKGDSSGSGTFTSLHESYGIVENDCGTGFHNFSASSEKTVGRLYCKGLKDETLNRSCAKGKRDQKYQDYGCDDILKQ